MAPQHSIVGSEAAFNHSYKRFAPAHGSLRTFGAPRRRTVPKWLLPSLLGSTLMFLIALGKTVSLGGI